MNDLVVNQVVEIPLIQRNNVGGANKKLKNTEFSAWASDLWNLQNWTMEG